MLVYTMGKMLITYNIVLITLEVDDRFVKPHSDVIVDKSNAEFYLSKNSNAKISRIIDEESNEYRMVMLPTPMDKIHNFNIGDFYDYPINIYLTPKRALADYITKGFNGISTSFFQNGEIESEINYINGKKNGLAKFWKSINNSKILYKEIVYKNNKIINSK
jgi:hypothetical protein